MHGRNKHAKEYEVYLIKFLIKEGREELELEEQEKKGRKEEEDEEEVKK